MDDFSFCVSLKAWFLYSSLYTETKYMMTTNQPEVLKFKKKKMKFSLIMQRKRYLKK